MLLANTATKSGSRRKKHKHSLSQRIGPISTRQYDEDSGQVYTETEVRFSSRQSSDWIGEYNTPNLIKKPYPNERGARSLFDVAKKKLARQFRDLNEDHFALVPWSMASKVWDEVVEIRAESYHTWRIFAKCYPKSTEFGQPQYRYHLYIRQPSLSLQFYFRGFESESMSWLTALRISPKQVSTADLIALANITNMAILDLSDGQVTIDHKSSNLDERVLRTWSELARTEDKFRHLRVLVFGWQEYVGDWIFKYMDSFPSLCNIIITDCPKLHQKNRGEWEQLSNEKGWMARHSKRSAKSLRPILDDKTFHLGAISGLYYESQNIFDGLITKRRPKPCERLPILECWLGTPRRWTHIIDDFPANRTVYFDNTRLKSSFTDTITDEEREHSSLDQVKRIRDHEQQLPETRSPPPKRASKPVLKKRPGGKNVEDVLNEFRTR